MKCAKNRIVILKLYKKERFDEFLIRKHLVLGAIYIKYYSQSPYNAMSNKMMKLDDAIDAHGLKIQGGGGGT
jgi:hypothetical protein